MAEGPLQYKSEQTPVPLSEIEEALLAAAGVGFTGIALWDQARPLPNPPTRGRTFPSTSGGRRTALFFTNDKGVYVIDPAGGPAASVSEIAGREHRERILDLYRNHRRDLWTVACRPYGKVAPPLTGRAWRALDETSPQAMSRSHGRQ
jgi:hypothetical protein